MCVNFATVSKLMDVFFFVHFFFIGWWYTHSLFADCMVGLFFIWYSRGAIYCLLLSSSFYLSLRLLLLSLTHTALTFSLSLPCSHFPFLLILFSPSGLFVACPLSRSRTADRFFTRSLVLLILYMLFARWFSATVSLTSLDGAATACPNVAL